MTDATEQKADRKRGVTTDIAHVVAASGLSYEQAAEFCDVSLDSMRSYASGRRKAPAKVLGRLSILCAFLTSRGKPRAGIPQTVIDRRQALIGLLDPSTPPGEQP